MHSWMPKPANGWRRRTPPSSRVAITRSQRPQTGGATITGPTGGSKRRGLRRRIWLVATSLLLVAACQGTIDLEPPLHVENGTELAVSIFVNDRQVAEYESMAGGEVDADLPALPWRVEARTAAGRVLTSLDVEPGDVITERGPNGVTHLSGPLGRVDLSCGRLSVWAGDLVPSGPAFVPNPGRPGDCEP